VKRYMIFAGILVLAVATVAFAADLRSNIVVKRTVDPVSTSNNDNSVGQIVDRLGYRSVTFVIVTGSVADSDATLTPTIHECDAANCSDAAVATGFVGTIAGATFAATDDNTVKTIGYTGGKRYVRLTLTPANNTGALLHSAVTILGHPRTGPTTQ